MATSIGSLFVTLDAETKGFLKGFAGAMEGVEKFAKEVKKAARDVAEIGQAVTAMGAGALALAATVDNDAKRAMDGLKESSTSLAIEVSRVLLPAVAQLTQMIQDAATWFANLDPGVKTAISNFAVWAVQVGLVATVLAKVAGLIDGMAGAIASLAKGIAGIGLGPLLTIIAVIAIIAAGVALLHKAWRENWGGIQEHVRGFLQWFSDAWSKFVGWFGPVIDKVAIKFLDVAVRIAAGAESMFRALGLDTLAGAAKSAREMLTTLREDIQREGVAGVARNIVEDMADAGKAAGKAFVDEWKMMLDEMGVGDIIDKLSGKGTKKPASGKPKKELQSLAGGYGDTSGFRSLNKAAEKDMQKAAERVAYGGATSAVSTKAAADAARAWWQGLEDAGADALPRLREKLVEVSGDFMDSMFGPVSPETGERGGTNIGGAVAQGVGTILGAAGEVGKVISSAIQGFQMGGVWGMIITIIAEVLVRLESFQQVLGELDAMFKTSIANINTGLKGFFDGFRAFQNWIAQMNNALEGSINALIKPLMDAIGGALSDLSEILRPLVSTVQAIAPVFAAIGAALGALSSAFKWAGPIIFNVIKYVSIALVAIFIGIGEVINAVLTFSAYITRAILATMTLGISEVDMNGKEAGGVLGEEMQNWLLGMTIDTKQMGSSLDQLTKMQYGQANALADTTKQVTVLGNTLADINEEFLNVPTGYKVALAQFNATAPDMEPASVGGPVASATIYIETVSVTTDSGEEVVEEIQEQARRDRYRDKGSTGGRGDEL